MYLVVFCKKVNYISFFCDKQVEGKDENALIEKYFRVDGWAN